MSEFERGTDEDLYWHPGANCAGVDPDLMFPETLEQEAIGKAVCADCMVRVDCYDYALSSGQTRGIWGGHNFGPDLEA